MRLLNTTTLKLHEFFEKDTPHYMILSHRWENDEVTFQDVKKGRNLDAAGWQKVRAFCKFARELQYEWAWVDTCCIDKRSSAELSEAINSMYTWYEKASVCIAYLCDVSCQLEEIWMAKEIQEDGNVIVNTEQAQLSQRTICELRESEWFTRGWTLQELIAPRHVVFLDNNWRPFGSKSTLSKLVSDITGIEKLAILYLDMESVATKMSWASKRICTRSEDQAYSLMGIFDVNMPLLYGEGGKKAFLRLQLEILKNSDDESIFAWCSPPEEHLGGIGGMLADTALNFLRSSQIRPFRPIAKRAPYSMTNKGLEIETVLLATRLNAQSIAYVPLNCARTGENLPIAIPLLCYSPGIYVRYLGGDSLLRWPTEQEVEEQDHYSSHRILIPQDLRVFWNQDRIREEFPDEVWASLRAAMTRILPT